MTQNFNDELNNLANQINALSRQMNNLNTNMNKYSVDMKHAFADMNAHSLSGYGWGGSDFQEFENRLINAFARAAGKTYKKNIGDHEVGDPLQSFADRVHKKLNKFSEDIAERLDVAQATGIGNLQIGEITENVEDLNKVGESLKLTSEQINNALAELGISMDSTIVTLNEKVKRIEGTNDYMRIDTWISQARDDFARLHNEIEPLIETTTKVNDTISTLANNSDLVNSTMANVSQNMDDLNHRLTLFAQMTSNATSASFATINQINNMNSAIGNFTTNINKNLTVISDATSKALKQIQNASNSANSNNGSSFREQAAKNSDRAKQAGFIALLIPALAKLLKKTPITDTLKFLALKLGSGLSGTGEHPVAGALSLAAAPLITGGLAAALSNKIVRNIFRSAGAKTLNGIIDTGASINKTTTSLGRTINTLNPFSAPIGQRKGFLSGAWDGFFAPRKLKNSAGVMVQGYEHYSPLKTSWNNYAMSYQTTANPNFVGQQRFNAFQSGRVARRALDMQISHMGRAISNTGASLSKGIVRRAPIIGSVLGALMEVPELIKAAKSGEKGALTKQLGKSAGGLTGGTIGAIAGGTLLGPLGVVLGGALGDIAGRVLGPALFDGFLTFTRGVKKDFQGIWEGLKATFNGLGKIITPLGKFLGLILTPAFKGLGLVLGGVVKAVTWGLNIFSRTIGTIIDKIGDFVQMVSDAFSWLGNKLLQIPGIGNILRNMFSTGTGGVDKEAKDNGNYGPSTGSVTRNVEDSINKSESKRETDQNTYNLVKEYWMHLNNINGGKKGFRNKSAYLNKMADFKRDYIKEHNLDKLLDGESVADYEKRRSTALNSDEFKKYQEDRMKKYISSEQARLNAISANNQNAIGSVIPSKLSTTTKNGIEAVAMKNLGLKGAIGAGNSVPYIAAANAQNLKNLDNYLSSKGYKFTYTSAMGGSHAGGAKSHGAGQKVDLVLNGGGRLRKEDERWLMANGFYGGSTGAVGYHNAGSGYHYDVSVSGGKGLTKAQIEAYNQATNNGTKIATTTATKEETASSEIRSGLADIVGAKNKSDKQEKARNIIFSAVDVTGSLGVWGITQLNNGVMRTGR